MQVHRDDNSAIGHWFQDYHAASFQFEPIAASTLTMTRINRKVARCGTIAAVLPAQKSYFLMIYLQDTAHSEVNTDGKVLDERIYRRGTICLVNLDQGAEIRLKATLNSLAFTIPHTLLNDILEIYGGRSHTRLVCRRGVPDPVLTSLGVGLLPFFEADIVPPSALMKHLGIAICAHLLNSYAERSTPPMSGGMNADH